MRLMDFFDRGAAIEPARDFLIDDGGRHSYAAVQASSHRIANALAARGIVPGTRVAVFSGNAASAFECVIGLLRAGCVWVPVNIRATVEEAAYVLDHTDTGLLFYSHALREPARQLLERCPGITHAVCIDAEDPPHPSLSLLTRDQPAVSPEVRPALDDVATLFSSGGTTGRPKGVMMTHLQWQTWVAASQGIYWHPHAINLVVAPMTHAAGGVALMMAAMGASHVILPGFDPVRVMQAIERHRVTHMFLPPTAIYRLLAHPDVRRYDYSSLRYFNYASAPMAVPKIKEAMEIFGPVMMTGFGQTETGPNTTYFSPQDHAEALASGDDRRFMSCGRATLFARVEVMDEDGGLLPAGETGEIVVRSTAVMKGYYKNPEETARVSGFGWHHTGDIGYKDAQGWIYLIDRKRDMMISGGFNIFPSEIERVLIAHAAVQDCAVVGVPHEEWGEAVKAVVELKPGASVEIGELAAHCRTCLAGYKVPKSIEIWPELPRSAAGKILRRKVRERYWQGRERQI
ncbi:MAG TPA: AMP-binding protein [Steroidobacteraceae bacterium]|nr:AMP-binding protein [Steroidobacteraceae bacterium]